MYSPGFDSRALSISSIGNLYFFVSLQFKYFQNEQAIGAEVAGRLRLEIGNSEKEMNEADANWRLKNIDSIQRKSFDVNTRLHLTKSY